VTAGAPSPRRPSVRGLVYAAGMLAVGATAVSLLGRFYWLFELTTHFRPQYVAVLVMAAATGLLARERRPAAAFGAVAVLNVLVSLSAWPWPSGNTVPDIQILAANVNTANREHHLVLDLVRSQGPDVVVLTEVDDQWLAALEPLAEGYAHRIVQPRSDNFGIGLWSRLPLEDGAVVRLGRAGVPSVLAKAVTPRGPVWVLATHPVPPSGGEMSALRNDQLEAVASLTDTLAGRVVVAGDLNATPWSPHFRRLLRVGGLRRARSVRALYTWPVGMPVLMVQLDHCLHRGNMRAAPLEVLTSIGSDHYPIACGFTFRDGGASP
jgi:endonuclease/exonuclease/phosphatase (EEP) superfamily protein YafD